MSEILDHQRASIEQGDKVSGVTATIYDGTDAGFGVPAWWGKYEDAEAGTEPQAGKARIVFADGRAGEIIVRDTHNGSGEFRGAGEIA